MRPLALLLVAVLLAPAASAQLSLPWVPRDDVNAALPPSIRAFESTDSQIPAWYVRADLGSGDWEMRSLLSRDADGAETVASFAGQVPETHVAINGGYFGGGQSFSLVLDQGTALASNIAALTRSGQTFYPTRGAFGLTPSRQPEVAWVYNVDGTQTAYPAPSPNAEGLPQPRPTSTFPAGGMPWAIETAIGGGPVLVRDGVVDPTWTEEVFFGGSGVDTTSTRARTAIGYTGDGALILLAIAENRGATLRETGEILASLGVVWGLNLDGGGSTNLIAGGQPLYTTTRQVASAVVLTAPSGETGRVFDTGDPGYSETGPWFESSNTPYYGPTRARLNEVGTGEDTATFVFEGIEAADYRVQGWWVPASNRATDTAITIYRDGEVFETYRVDQSDPGTAGQWNDIGLVPLASGDSLVVTDAATSGSGPTFVCVDAIRLVPAVVEASESGPVRRIRLDLAPNPARESTALGLDLAMPGRVAAEVVDVLGRIVWRTERVLGSGTQTITLDARALPAGRYVVRATTPDGTGSRLLTVVH